MCPKKRTVKNALQGAPAPSGGSDIDLDVNVGGGEEEAAPVPAMENETFEEPQSPVVEVDDLIE